MHSEAESQDHPATPLVPSGSYRCKLTGLIGVFPYLEECLDFLKKNPEENFNQDPALYELSEKLPNYGVIFEFMIYNRER
jgi:hypothetical protein